MTQGPIGCTEVGTEGPDELQASAGAAGPQTFCGLGDNDTIVGSSGGDVLLGGPGDDTLTASSEGGLIDGGDGADVCTQSTPVVEPAQFLNCEG
ncbi:MAG: hypothetical protein HKN24_14805 [Acidimicrobiales bacterium]|nr:hypothetical protein [Acidimicrobiales bacterium]